MLFGRIEYFSSRIIVLLKIKWIWKDFELNIYKTIYSVQILDINIGVHQWKATFVFVFLTNMGNMKLKFFLHQRYFIWKITIGSYLYETLAHCLFLCIFCFSSRFFSPLLDYFIKSCGAYNYSILIWWGLPFPNLT